MHLVLLLLAFAAISPRRVVSIACYGGISLPRSGYVDGDVIACSDSYCTNSSVVIGSTIVTIHTCGFSICNFNSACFSTENGISVCCCNQAMCNSPPTGPPPSPPSTANLSRMCYVGIESASITDTSLKTCDGQCGTISILTNDVASSGNVTYYTCEPSVFCDYFGLNNACSSILNFFVQGVTACCCDRDNCNTPVNINSTQTLATNPQTQQTTPTTPVAISTPTTDEDPSRPCACTSHSAWLDVVLLIDTSSNVGTGIGDVTSFLVSIFNQFTISQTVPASTRVGIVTYSDRPIQVGRLNTYRDGDALARALRGIRTSFSNQLNLRTGLEAAVLEFRENGNRVNARNVIIVIASDYRVNSVFDDPTSIAYGFKQDNGIIITIGYGRTFRDLSQLGGLASPGMNFSTIVDTANLFGNIIQSLCSANCFCHGGDRQYSQTNDNGTTIRLNECFTVTSFPATFDNALSSCQRRSSSTLVNILGNRKSQYIKTLNSETFSQDKFWIGLRYSNGNYRWTGSGLTASFTDWNPGFPNQALGDCVYMGRAGGFRFGWQNGACSDTVNDFHDYFCQYNACDTDNYCTEPV